MFRSTIKIMLVVVFALSAVFGIMGCNQYISGAKVALQLDPPDYDRAISNLTEGLEYAPKDPDMHALLAYCYVQTKKYKEAGKEYASAIEYSPTQKDSLQKVWDGAWEDLYNMAGTYIKKSATGSKDSNSIYLQKAEEHIDYAIDIAPNKVENYIRKGLIYRYSEKVNESEAFFAKAVSLDPGNPDAYYQIGRAAMDAQNWDEAIKNISKAVQLKKDNDQWFYTLGVAYLRKMDFPNAEKSFMASTKIKPDNKDAWYNLGQAYYYEGTNIPAAIEALNKVIELDNNDIDALSLMGLACLHNSVNNYDKAIEVYTRAVAINPESQEYKNNLEYAKKQKEASQKPVVTPKKKRR
jgi:tetratricopeptide (TPR) repeat protein